MVQEIICELLSYPERAFSITICDQKEEKVHDEKIANLNARVKLAGSSHQFKPIPVFLAINY